MKKFIVAILSLIMILTCSFSLADVDISGLTYDELVNLVNEAQMLIMKSDKWQEVEVPEGTYLIGTDIPAGKWTISCNEHYYVELEVGYKIKPNGSVDMLADMDNYMYSSLYGQKYSLYNEGDTSFITWDLKEGQYIRISKGSAYFTPFKGNSFKFK